MLTSPNKSLSCKRRALFSYFVLIDCDALCLSDSDPVRSDESMNLAMDLVFFNKNILSLVEFHGLLYSTAFFM